MSKNNIYLCTDLSFLDACTWLLSKKLGLELAKEKKLHFRKKQKSIMSNASHLS